MYDSEHVQPDAKNYELAGNDISGNMDEAGVGLEQPDLPSNTRLVACNFHTSMELELVV